MKLIIEESDVGVSININDLAIATRRLELLLKRSATNYSLIDSSQAHIEKDSTGVTESGAKAIWGLEKVETFYDEDKTIPSEIYYTDKNQRLDGPYESFHRNGAPDIKCTYKNGALDGLFESFCDNNQLRVKRAYKNGIEEGLYESFRRDGSPDVKCTYKNGALDGLHESFHRNGIINVKCNYKNGFLVGEYVQSDDGVIRIIP